MKNKIIIRKRNFRISNSFSLKIWITNRYCYKITQISTRKTLDQMACFACFQSRFIKTQIKYHNWPWNLYTILLLWLRHILCGTWGSPCPPSTACLYCQNTPFLQQNYYSHKWLLLQFIPLVISHSVDTLFLLSILVYS